MLPLCERCWLKTRDAKREQDRIPYLLRISFPYTPLLNRQRALYHSSYYSTNRWKILSLSRPWTSSGTDQKKKNSSMPPSSCVPLTSELPYSLAILSWLSQFFLASLFYAYSPSVRSHEQTQPLLFLIHARDALATWWCCSSCSRRFHHVIKSSAVFIHSLPHSSLFPRCSPSALTNVTQPIPVVPDPTGSLSLLSRRWTQQ